MNKAIILITTLFLCSMMLSCGDDEPQNAKETVVDLSNATETTDGYYDGLLYFKLISYDEAAVTKCNKGAVDVQIPEKVKLNGKTYTVRIIGSSAFSGCSSLQSVVIANTVTTIKSHAFYSSSLPSVTIPNSVTSIGEYAFSGCRGLSGLTIPNSVISIGDYAFYCCYGLTSVTISNSVTEIGLGAFSECISLSSMTIPNSVTSIGRYVFEGCRGLTSVTIPSSVTSIGYRAFKDCYKLQIVKSLNPTPPHVDNEGFGFDHVGHNASLQVPKSSVESYKSAPEWKNFKNIIGI